jgi:DNA-binding response OmpR family regulator
MVDLNSNTISFGDKTAILTPGQAEIVAVLADISPAALAFERLILRVWGGFEPENVKNVLRVQTCLARPKLRPLGLTIVAPERRGLALRQITAIETGGAVTPSTRRITKGVQGGQSYN